MAKQLHATAMATIQTHNMLAPGQGVLVALSGGADSVVLLHTLLGLQSKLAIGGIYAVHINHGLRPGAMADQNLVADMCKALGVPLEIYQVDVAQYARDNKLTIEEAGRNMRYQCFAQGLAHFGAGKIATGHHQNDNAETVLLNLSRGAGLKGLCGIPYVNGNVVRPLLDISRVQIDQYITNNNLAHAIDESNYTQDYARNRIRLAVLPALEAATNPQATQTIAKNASWLRAEEEYLEDVAQDAYKSCLTNDGDSPWAMFFPATQHISLCANALGGLPVAICRRVVRIAISKAVTLANISATHIQAVMDLLPQKSGKEAHLPGLVVSKEYSSIVFAPAHSQVLYNMKEQVLKPNQYTPIPQLGIGLLLHDQHSPVTPLLKCPKKLHLLCTKAFNYGIVEGELLLRTRKQGDKIALGSPAHPFTKKLQDFFTDKKIPRHLRDIAPVIACGNNVKWVLGMATAIHVPSNNTMYISVMC